jgi:hypothetical protein
MRKPASVVITLSVALILILLSTEMRTSVVMAQAKGPGLLAAKTGSSGSLNPTLQDAPFIWVSPGEERDYPAYRRVVGGKHQDGTTMYFCKFNFVPAKLYKNECHYSYGGYERVDTKIYRVLLTNKEYQWVAVDAVSRDEIKQGAVKGGVDQGNDTIYLCRMKMSDGVHPGKYSYKNNRCYIPWGNKEYSYPAGFELLFR